MTTLHRGVLQVGELLWRGPDPAVYLLCCLQGALQREQLLNDSLWRQVAAAKTNQDVSLTAAIFSVMERNRVGYPQRL